MSRGCLVSLICAVAYVAMVFLVSWAVCLCFSIPFRFRYGLGALIIAATARPLLIGIAVNRRQQ